MNFHDLVVQALVEKDNADVDSTEEVKFEIPIVIGTTLDLSNEGLEYFPKELCQRSPHVQLLYLEGNLLDELPDDFFNELFSLKWLDIRKNRLTHLPTKGLIGHPHLETLLLQGNLIKTVPTELVMVPNLRGLQLAGNPIQNIPFDVIANGFKAVIKHLKSIGGTENGPQPVSDTIIKKSTKKKSIDHDILDESSTNSSAFTHESSNTDYSLKKENHSDDKITVNRTSFAREQQFIKKEQRLTFQTTKKKKTPHCSESVPIKYLAKPTAMRQKRSMLGYTRKPLTMKKLQENMEKAIQLARKRETLERQAQIIQRMKDKAALKEWRKMYKQSEIEIKLLDNYQQYPNKEFVNKTPFDVDPDFLAMLSRVDLYHSLKDMEAKTRRKRQQCTSNTLTTTDLDNQMADVMSKLEKLNVEFEETETSTLNKKKIIGDKITQITELQKVLQKLQQENKICGSPNILKKSGITCEPISTGIKLNSRY